MVVGNFYIKRASIFPDETNAPLTVDSNAVLTCPLLLECFEMVATIDRQHLKASRRMQHQKFPARRPQERLEPSHRTVVKSVFGLSVLERHDRHYVYRMTSRVICQADSLAERV